MLAKMATSRRGVFVLFEGVDRCGKTTQTKLLHEALQTARGRTASLLHFPDRSTAIGQSIHSYLTTTDAMDDRAIHLLFSANRWEAAAKIEQLLTSGVDIVMDRYAYSGVAFSAAKPALTLDWCWQPEVGLPKPDTVIFLDIPVDKASSRADFGQERYETSAFQHKVYANFQRIMEQASPKWHVLDATETIEQVHARALAIADACIAENETRPLQRFEKLA
jgi:dTMP kinase